MKNMRRACIILLLFLLHTSFTGCLSIASGIIGSVVSMPFEEDVDLKYEDDADRACHTLENTPELVVPRDDYPPTLPRSIQENTLFAGLMLDLLVAAGLTYTGAIQGDFWLGFGGVFYAMNAGFAYPGLARDLTRSRPQPSRQPGRPVMKGSYYFSQEEGCDGDHTYRYRIFEAGRMDNRTVKELDYNQRKEKCSHRFFQNTVRIMEIEDPSFSRDRMHQLLSGCWQSSEFEKCYCRVSYRSAE